MRVLHTLTRLTALKLGAGTDEEGEEYPSVHLPPLAGLAALTELELRALVELPAPTLLASLPRLSRVHVWYIPDAWRGQLAALRPDITCSAEHD